MTITEHIAAVRREMAEAARESGRSERDIILVGASKMNDAAACQEAIAAGVDALGENRVQEMTAKLAQNAYDGAPLHFIGHLQRNKVRQVVDYELGEIEAKKLFLGVPVYGYDWPLPYRQGVTRGVSVAPREALDLARRQGAEIQFDETAQAPWFRYTAADGREHEVWFEDARSSYAKFRLAAEKCLQGVGLWNLMRPAVQTYFVLHG